MTGEYRREIDGLRALAVLAVVLFHARIPGFSGGFAGVDIFLVISGYLIGGLILREADAGRFTLAGFYERRVRRILPALLAMLAVSLLAAWMLLPPDFRQFGASLTAISLLLSNFLFERSTGYFALTENATPLLHTWSLAVEEQFYLLFPVALLLARRGGPVATRAALAGAAALSFAYSVWAVRTDPAMAFYSPASRAWEFLAGALLASGMIRPPARRDAGDAAALLGLALLGFALWRLTGASPFPGINALAPVLGTVLLLYGTQAEESRVAQWLGIRPLVAIGLISYSLYLWHWPLIVFGGYYVLNEHWVTTVRVAMALLAFPVAWVSWRYVERPFRKPRALLSRRTLFAAAAGTSLTLALAGAAIYLLNGIPSRFTPVVQHLAEVGETPDYGCTSRSLDMVLAEPRCRIGDPSVAPSFVLWGDSHAAVYFPELKARATAHGVSGYNITTFGCPPLLSMLGPERKIAARNAKMADCRERNARALKLITEQRLTVILAAYWGSYGARGGKHRVDGSVEADPTGFEAGVAMLRGLGITVYVVLDVPHAERLSVRDLAKAQVIGYPGGTGPSVADYLRRTGTMRTLALDMQRRGLVEVIEPGRILCDPRSCRMTEGDYPLYFDSNHLNARGAHAVGPLFEPMFQRLAAAPVKAN